MTHLSLGMYLLQRYTPSVRLKDALRALAEVTAYQWGMVTSAQASMHGITRLELSRLAADGQLERLAHGVYKDTGAPAGPHASLQAAWLSTEPKTMGAVRIKDAATGVVVAGESAADLHSIVHGTTQCQISFYIPFQIVYNRAFAFQLFL